MKSIQDDYTCAHVCCLQVLMSAAGIQIGVGMNASEP